MIPLTLDLLGKAITELEQANREAVSQTDTTWPEHQTPADDAEKTSVNATENPHAPTQSSKPVCKGADRWRPAWRPPGPRRM